MRKAQLINYFAFAQYPSMQFNSDRYYQTEMQDCIIIFQFVNTYNDAFIN